MVKNYFVPAFIILFTIAGIVASIVFASPPVSSRASIPVNLPSQEDLVRKLKAGQYQALDESLARLQARYETGSLSEGRLKKAFSAFERIDPKLDAPLRAWREKFPNSFSSQLAFGLYNQNLAWTARGEAWSAYTNREQFRVMNEYLKAAIKALWKAIDLNPRQPSAWEALVRIAMTTGDQMSLGSVYTQAKKNVPASSILYHSYHYALSPKWGGSKLAQFFLRLELRLRFWDDARFDWVRYHSEYEKIDEYLYDPSPGFVSRILESIGAENLVQTWFAYFPEEKPAILALGLIDSMISRSDSSWLRARRGDALAAVGKYDDALLEHLQAIRMSPNRDRTLLVVASFYHVKRQYAESDKYWRRAIERNPYDPELVVEYSKFLLEIGETQAATEMLERALVFGGHKDDVRREMGRHYWKLKKFDRSLSEFKRAVELVPERPENWFRYANAERHMKNCVASSAYKTYLELCKKWENCKISRRSIARSEIGYIEKGCD